MKAIIKHAEVIGKNYDRCHDGAGTLVCKNMLVGAGSTQYKYFHCDDIAAGVSIGVHNHTNCEEIYYLQSGSGILTFDGVEYKMEAGDISLCKIGHSHGFFATTNCVLLVVC